MGNTDAKVERKSKTEVRLLDWGHGPVRAEGVPATITLPASATRTTCRALDERGEPKADVPVTADADGHAVVTIGPAFRTVWYEISIKGQ